MFSSQNDLNGSNNRLRKSAQVLYIITNDSNYVACYSN